MPRPNLIRSSRNFYHVKTFTFNKESFPLPMAEVWNIMERELVRLKQEQELCVHGFILMENHFHFLCQTPKENLDQIMQSFLRRTSRIISNKASHKKFKWGGRYRWSMIESQIYFHQVYRYVFQNPLRTETVMRVEDYLYSTLKENCSYSLSWLNDRYAEDDLELIRLGLRKSHFDIRKRRAVKFKRLKGPLGGV